MSSDILAVVGVPANNTSGEPPHSVGNLTKWRYPPTSKGSSGNAPKHSRTRWGINLAGNLGCFVVPLLGCFLGVYVAVFARRRFFRFQIIFVCAPPSGCQRRPVFSSKRQAFSTKRPVFFTKRPVFSSRKPAFSSKRQAFWRRKQGTLVGYHRRIYIIVLPNALKTIELNSRILFLVKN